MVRHSTHGAFENTHEGEGNTLSDNSTLIHGLRFETIAPHAKRFVKLPFTQLQQIGKGGKQGSLRSEEDKHPEFAPGCSK
jgi:hypothetical protein